MTYEVKMTRMGVEENGKNKKFNETYLVEALTIYEAITKFETYITDFYPDHKTVAIKQTPYNEIKDSEGDGYYYHANTKILTIDERTGAEKKEPYHMLIKAADFDEAKSIYEELVKTWTIDLSLSSIKETKILEYISF